jgi:hypothetical protein
MEIITIKGDTVPAARCDPDTLEGCDEKERSFITKIVGVCLLLLLFIFSQSFLGLPLQAPHPSRLVHSTARKLSRARELKDRRVLE